jgi:hypothetical protein
MLCFKEYAKCVYMEYRTERFNICVSLGTILASAYDFRYMNSFVPKLSLVSSL